LPDGRVESYFRFDVNVTANNEGVYRHFNLLPQALGNLAHRYSIEHLDISFTQGRWQYDKWGPPNREQGIGTGSEIVVWLDDNFEGDLGQQNIDLRWAGLTAELAGLFCASLNFIDSSLTYSPKRTFVKPDTGHHTASTLRTGHLAGETVCTENLTPFIKLLPCRDRAGLAVLFDGHALYGADFHNMAVSLTRHRPQTDSTTIYIRQTLQTIHNPIRTSILSKGEKRGKRDWSLDILFSKRLQILRHLDGSITASCPLAKSSKIEVDLSGKGGVHGAYWTWPKTEEKEGDKILWDLSHLEHYEVAEGSQFDTDAYFDLGMKWNEDTFQRSSSLQSQAIEFRRYLTGTGGERGGMRFEIQNNHHTTYNGSLTVNLPWLIRPFLHTLRIFIQSDPIQGSSVSNHGPVIQEMLYQPAIDRLRPTELEVLLSIPAYTRLHILFLFEKTFIRYSEYPPDANRGFDIAPAILTTAKHISSDDDTFPGILYTTNALLDLSTPDFSMCYNVIILSCTVISLIFGSTMNILLRNFELKAEP